MKRKEMATVSKHLALPSSPVTGTHLISGVLSAALEVVLFININYIPT